MAYTRELPIRRAVSVREGADAFCTLQKAASGVSDAFSELQNTAEHRWVLSGRRRETEVFLLNISQSFRVKPLTSARRKGNARRAIRGRREASSRPKGKRMANKKLLPLQLRSMRIPEGFESACS